MPSMRDDERWMREAIAEARNCLRSSIIPHSELRTPHSDVPSGAICVRDGEIIGRGHNRREADSDPTAHAEVLALREASQNSDSWRLENVTLYVTLEPCAMCAGALWLARVERLVFGAWDEKAGACGSLFDIPRDPRLNHQLQVRGGVLREDCAELLREFFIAQRKPKEILATDEHG